MASSRGHPEQIAIASSVAVMDDQGIIRTCPGTIMVV
jgi:hypothetical protein